MAKNIIFKSLRNVESVDHPVSLNYCKELANVHHILTNVKTFLKTPTA